MVNIGYFIGFVERKVNALVVQTSKTISFRKTL